MKKIIPIVFALVFAYSFSEAQCFVTLKSGAAGDTLKASTTYTVAPVNISGSGTMQVTATVAIDSISGTPAGTFTMRQSVDGKPGHFITAGTPWVFTKSGTGTHSQIISLNPFLGRWVDFTVVTTSATQKSKYYITVQSVNVR